MAGEWRDVALEDVADELTVGYVGPMSSEYVDDGVPFLRSLNVEPLRINKNDLKFITPEFHRRIQKSRLTPGDVVIVRTGKPGACSVVPDWLADANCSDLVIVRCGTQLNNWFLAYYINTVATDHVAAHLVGAVQQHFNVGSARKLRLTLPPLAEQKEIASVLRALDDKIELNRRMNATLESMARALFQSWFVDFDPVRAKLDGRQPIGMDPATAALFPEHLEDSPLGHIPKGWKVTTIESLCDYITSGGTPARMHKPYWEPAEVPWFKTGELTDGPLIDAEEKISAEGLANSSCKLWPAGTILFALYASPTVGRFGVLTKPGTANQAAAALIPKPAFGVPFLVGLLYEARAELQRVAVGAAQQNINQGVLKSHEVITPPPALAKAYSEMVGPWFEQRINLTEQSRTLATLRDTLLPKLLSGELSVASLESKLKAVT